MGSLMGGWDSHAPDPKSVAVQRNKSYTKEEIEAYWRSKKKTDDDDDDHIHMECNDKDNDNIDGRSKLLPTKQDWMKKVGGDDDTKMEKFVMKNAWWRGSKWAFLNEPPVLQNTPNTYKPQFQFHSSKTSGAAA